MTININDFNNLNILCIGDIMLDKFNYGKVERISPEAPIPVFLEQQETAMPGGVGNVANNLLSLGSKVTLISGIGNDRNGKELADILQNNVNLESLLFASDDLVTTTKTRYVSGNNHFIRIDREEYYTIDATIEEKLIEKIFEYSSIVDAIIVSDYNKGFLTPGIKAAIASIKRDGLIKILDSKADIGDFANGGVDVFAPNLKELEHYSDYKIKTDGDIVLAVEKFYSKYKIKNILVTASAKGMILFRYDETTNVWELTSKNAPDVDVVDVSGAGDTVVASFALASSLSSDDNKILDFTTECAGIVISKRGTSTVSKQDFSEKYSLERTLYLVEQEKETGKKIGLVNGCFDIFHNGHLDHLKKSKSMCDYLVVAINSDDSIARIKDESARVYSQEDRANLLDALECVDAVLIFDEDEPSTVINTIKPSVIFKGSDYRDQKLVEQQAIDNNDVSVVFIERLETQNKKNKIREILKSSTKKD